MPPTLKSLIDKAPQKPGVYKFLDEKEKVIYVGKAKSLKKRLQSYIQKSKDQGINPAKVGVKTQKMLEHAKGVEWIETNTEVEALILEDSLIKEIQPKYNVLLKDDKNFQYIKVTVGDDYPEVLTVRKIEKDGAKYFGPKTSGGDVKRILETIKRIFRLCSVRQISVDPKGTPLPGAKVAVKHGKMPAKRPCLDFHIKRCTGPCAGMVTPDEYLRQIQEALEFLGGNFKPATEALRKQMMDYAAERKFERAGALRDQIAAIERSAEKQLIRDTTLSERDIIAFVTDLGKNFFALHQVRAGRLIAQENFITEGEDTPDQIMESFVRDYYGLAADIPKEVLISVDVPDAPALEGFIREKASHAVHLIRPKVGKKDDLILLAEKNARSYADQNRARWMADEKKPEEAAQELQKALNLKTPLKRIECYDISHLSGTETVGSMTVFKKGVPSKADYRLFRLKTIAHGEIDDFKAMAEVIRRRLNYLPDQLPAGYKIRKATKADDAFVRAHNPVTLKLDYDLKHYYVMEKDGALVGTGRTFSLSDKVTCLNGLWIDPKERGKKLGYFMLRHLIEKAKASRLYIACKKELQDYYLGAGFEILREPPTEMKERARHFDELTNRKTERLFMAYQKKKKDLSFTARPDLMVIDGGKGQLSAAHQVLQDKGLTGIPMISLAKKLEEVFIPKTSDPINLPNDSQASYLLQRIRDEAHRFAIELNRSRREKSMTKSALDDVPGLGPKMRQRLLSHFGSTQSIREATVEQLTPICGEMLAKRLKEGV